MIVALEPWPHLRAVANAESDGIKAVIEGTKSNALTLEAVAFANRSVPPIVCSVDDNKVGIVK